MSTTPAPQLPDFQTAYDNLFFGVRSNAFFSKLAEFGVQPRNEKEAASLMEMAGIIRAAKEEQMAKVASDSDDPFAAVNQILRGHLDQQGFSMHKQAGSGRAEAQASQIMQDPTIYNSVLGIKAAEAHYWAGQVQQNQVAA